MRTETRLAVEAIFRTDSTIDNSEKARLVKLMTNPPPDKREELPRLLRRGDVSKMLAISTRGVDRLCKSGVLRKVKLPCRSRAGGIPLAQVIALIEGHEDKESAV